MSDVSDHSVPGGAADPPPLLELIDIHKSFGGIRALNGAHLALDEPGIVHGLIGENGSGKSTLLGVLSGQLPPDAGEIRISGVPTSFNGPAAALANGIAMVSQETAVALDLTVAENILLGRRLVRGAAGISWRATKRRAVEILERLQLDYDPDATVRSLRPDQRQMVEIARALSLDSRILILDEPTSSLSDDEVLALFAAIRRLKVASVTTLFVSHRLAELFEICDELTVLRDGQTQGAGAMTGFTRDSLVDLMVGPRKSAELVPRGEWDALPAHTGREVAMTVRDLCVTGAVRDVSFDLHAGEIVGVAGLVGAGRSEMLGAVFGANDRSAGTVSVFGKAVHGTSPRAAIRRGIGFVPPDRKEQGVVLGVGVRDNALMVATCRDGRLRRPRADGREARFRAVAQALNLRYGSEHHLVSTLSGGNQQKVALSKWLIDPPKVLILDEPTRGVDVRAKDDIHGLLRELAGRGMALLVSSSDNEELLALCDRVIVMSRGAVVATVDRQDVDEAQLTSLAGGHS